MLCEFTNLIDNYNRDDIKIPFKLLMQALQIFMTAANLNKSYKIKTSMTQ